jgi:hypothetical protein
MEIAKMVNHNVLNHLFVLASSKKSHEEVNARTYAILKKTKQILDKKGPEEYHYHYLSDKISMFFSGDLEVNYLEELKPPDGSPIGSHDHTFSSCSSEL